MYDEMTIADLLVVAHQEAYPEDQPSAEHAPLINELVRRLRRLDVWRSNVSAEMNLYLTDDDGSDLLPEPKRIRNMLERLSSAQAAPVSEGKGPTDDELALIYHDCCGGCEFMDQGGFENAARAVLIRYGHQPLPPAKGEVEKLVAWLRETGDLIQPSYLAEHQRYKRAAALLEQRHPTPVPVGMIPVEYWDIDSGARIVSELSEDGPGGCWIVLNSRHINPLDEFQTAQAAWDALQQATAMPLPSGEVEHD